MRLFSSRSTQARDVKSTKRQREEEDGRLVSDGLESSAIEDDIEGEQGEARRSRMFLSRQGDSSLHNSWVMAL